MQLFKKADLKVLLTMRLTNIGFSAEDADFIIDENKEIIIDLMDIQTKYVIFVSEIKNLVIKEFCGRQSQLNVLINERLDVSALQLQKLFVSPHKRK